MNFCLSFISLNNMNHVQEVHSFSNPKTGLTKHWLRVCTHQRAQWVRSNLESSVSPAVVILRALSDGSRCKGMGDQSPVPFQSERRVSETMKEVGMGWAELWRGRKNQNKAEWQYLEKSLEPRSTRFLDAKPTQHQQLSTGTSKTTILSLPD